MRGSRDARAPGCLCRAARSRRGARPSISACRSSGSTSELRGSWGIVERTRPCPAYDRNVETAQQLVKPRLRGVFHEIGFYAAIVIGVVVIVTADPGRARVAGAIFASCVALCF